MWGGMYPGDDYYQIVIGMAKGNGVKEVLNQIESLELGYKGIQMNMVMADDSGDIGYAMLAPVPKRRSSIPYHSSRVLNGETTEFDWEGSLIPGSDYPRSINPERGYFVTANNRQVSDHSRFDFCASSTSTPRAERIAELIESKIKQGLKFSPQDVSAIQQDDTDVFARKVAPKLIHILEEGARSHVEIEVLRKIQPFFRDWEGRFNIESVAASIYSYTLLFWQRELLPESLFPTLEDRLKITENHAFLDF
jgi:penicillin amidase